MTPRKPKPDADDDDVQKVSLEAVGPKAKEAHAAAMKESVLSREVLIAGFVAITALGTFGQMWMQYRTSEAQRMRDVVVATKVDEVADKAKAVKEALDQTTKNTDKQLEANEKKLDDLTKTTDEVRISVNGGSTNTLKLLAEVTRWKAIETGLPEDKKAADLAEKNFRDHVENTQKANEKEKRNVQDHEAKQAAVDAAAKEK